MIEWDDDKRNETLRERGPDFAEIATVDWDGAMTMEDIRRSLPPLFRLPQTSAMLLTRPFMVVCAFLHGVIVVGTSG